MSTRDGKESIVDKAERHYVHFCEKLGLPAANAEVTATAIEWHRARSICGDAFPPRVRALTEMKLCEAIEKVSAITRQAAIVASEWAKTEDEPA